MAKSEPHEVVRDLLRLRRWAVGVLSAGDNSSAVVVDGISAETWRLFLSLERCAALLLDRVSGPAAKARVDSAALDMMRKVAATEMQTSMRARVDGRELSALAQRLSFPIVVLKGGVPAIAGQNPVLPIGDIDILVPGEHVADMVEVLTSAGFGERTRDLDHHHSVEPTVERLRVEVHWSTHDDGSPIDAAVWTRIRPIDNAPPLKQLGASDNLVHLVEHAVDTHRERSVSLRDTVLIGMCAESCSGSELSTARKELSHNSAMTSLLDLAIEMRNGIPAADPFFEGCASFYSAVALSDDLPKALSSRGALAFVTALEQSRVPYTNTLRRTLKWRGTDVERLSGIAKRFPQFGRLLLAPTRLAYYCVVAALTIPAIRRTRRKALTSLGLQTH